MLSLLILPCLLAGSCSVDLTTGTQATQEAPDRVDVGRFLTSRKSDITLPLTDEKDSFFFIVYGDRTGGPAEGVAILREAVAETNLIGPDLVMTVGDLIQGYNEPAEWIVQMEEYRDAMGALNVPWFPVAGNHDIYYRGENRPVQEHEGRYEMHFGPLWYAFRHKSAWFIVLYTDEPDPKTGERNFSKPASQRMSPEQLAWLDETLAVTKSAEHVFVFCHHPRWIGGNYGNDWDKVHQRLVAAGNVKGVFGGHIHRMRYDPKDGIEYFSVATIGGHQSGSVPEAGYLHCYDIVTVRPDRIERATLPVGAAMDPREITGEVSVEAPKLLSVQPRWDGAIKVADTGAVKQTLAFTLDNPARRSVETEAYFFSHDPRWTIVPDHVHGTLTPGGKLTFSLSVSRPKGSLDDALQMPKMRLGFDYLTDTARFAIPVRDVYLPIDLSSLSEPPVPATERVLHLTGTRAHVRVDSAALDVPDGPFTVEAWVNPRALKRRQGLVCKTEGSEYGLFAGNGELEFAVHLDGAYVTPTSTTRRVVAGRWQHVAGVFDGSEVRVYLDGELVAQADGQGRRTRNALPLIVGGDVDKGGSATATLDGDLDEVRISAGARYAGARFTPARRFTVDADTLLLLHMDAVIDPFLRGGRCAGARLEGGAKVTDG